MLRTVVFAHYDKDNIISGYVLYYLKALKEVCGRIIFVSACELSDFELEKLKGLTNYIIAENHQEYDFGSYKRGFLYLQENNLLEKTDELVFANDSCYGPLYPLKNVFEKMENKSCDWWGLIKNKFGFIQTPLGVKHCERPHIQSYFMVFKPKVFLSKVFEEFIENICQQDDKNQIILKYEIGLSEYLDEKGFVKAAYINDFYYSNNPSILKWRELVQKSEMPFIKCILLKLNCTLYTTIVDWQYLIKQNSDYPIELIENNLKRAGTRKIKCFVPLILKRIYFDFLSRINFYVGRRILKISKICLPFIFD